MKNIPVLVWFCISIGIVVTGVALVFSKQHSPHLSVVSSVSAQTPVPEAGIRAGTGQATRALTLKDVAAMTIEAASEVRAAYGSGTPKLVLLTENIGSPATILEKLGAEFNGAPIYGVATGRGKYMPVTIEEYPDHATDPFMRSIAVVALGGNQISRIEAARQEGLIEDWNGGDAASRFAVGQALAQQLHPDPTEKNLILVMNSMHGDSAKDVVNGMKQVLGTPLPGNIRLTGWGGLDGAAYFNGTYYPLGPVTTPPNRTESIVAVMISGTFDWAFSGSAQSSNPWVNPVPEVQARFNSVVSELGGVPDVSFLLPGHPDLSDRPAYLDAIRGIIGPSGKLFGWEAASETGHDTTTNDGFGSTYHMYVVGLKGTARSVPSPTTPPPTSPTPTRVPGDTNNDRMVNLSDLAAILMNFGTLSGATRVQGDLDGNGSVNLSDLAILLTNFGT